MASKKQDKKKKTPALPMAFTPIGSQFKLTPQLPKATNIIDQAAKQSKAQIAQQKVNYANARNQGDYAGMRIANTLANKARAVQGAPAYSSSAGDTQFQSNLPKALPKANVARVSNYLNTGISAPLQPTNTPAYAQSYKQGNYLKGTGQLALSTLGAGADLLRNVSANAVSLTSGKGLQPYRVDYTKQQYEQNINKLTGNTPLYKQLEKLNPKVSQAYLTTGEILEDPLNLFDVGAKITASGLKTAGSAIYAQDLLKGGKNFIPATTKTNMPTLTPSGKIKNVKTTLPVNNTSGFLGQIGDKFEVGKPIVTASGKKIANAEDFKKLPTTEKVEVLKTISKAQNQAVQPRNANLGTSLPTAQKTALKTNLNAQTLPKASDVLPQRLQTNVAQPKFKDLGADVNKFPQQLKTSKFKTNTMRNSKVFSEAEKNIDDAVYEYEVVSEKQSLKEAEQRLQADFDGEVKDLSTKKDFDGVDLDTSMGIAEQYLKEAEQTGDYKQFLNWTKKIQEKGTQGGQLIQAFAKYTRTPEGAVIKGQQTINKVIKELSKNNPKLLDSIDEETKDILRKALNGDFKKIKGSKKFVEDIRNLASNGNISKESIEELVKGKYDIPTLSNNDVKNITENMKLGQDAADPYMKEMYFNRAEQIISDKVPAKFREKFRALQRLSLILNPKTLITRNPLGNVVLGTAENIKDIPASLVDRLVSLKTGERTTTGLSLEKLQAQLQGAGQGLTEWAKDIKYGVDTSPSRGQFELPNKRIFKNPVLNSLDMFERSALQIGDRPFYQAAYNSRIAELKKLGKTGEEAETQAKLYALDRVFQNNSELSKRAISIRKNLGLFGDVIIPFTQTPANILDKLLDYSPVGLGKAVAELGKTTKGTFNQKRFVDLIGRNLTGTGIAILGYAMAKDGIITPDLYGTNKDLYNAQQLAGQKSYAFKIGDKYYTFDWASPIGNILAAAADVQKAMADKDDFLDALGAGGQTAVDTVFDKSFLSGLLTALSGYSPASGIANALLGATTQATPTGTANIAKTIDPYVRETYDPNRLKQTGKKLVARLPLLSETLPKKLDITGKPLMQNQGRGIVSRAYENFLAPYNLGVENPDKVNDEAMRLQKATGNNNVLLNAANKYVEYGGKRTQLSTSQYQKYQKLIGQNAYKQISDLMDTQEYKNMNDEEKANAIQKINDEVGKEAKKKILVSVGYDPKNVWLKDLGKEVAENYSSMKNVSAEDYYKTYKNMIDKTNEVGSSSNIYKAIALSELGADKTYYDAFGVTSKSTDYKNVADQFKKYGISAEQYNNYRSSADTDGNNSVKKTEAIEYLNTLNIPKEQKKILFSTMCPSVKKNPYN